MIDIITSIDFFILQLIQSHVVRDSFTPVLKVLTTIGNAGAIWIVLGLILTLNKRTRKVGIIFLVFLAIEHFGINTTLKHHFARPRPFVQDPAITLLINAPKDTSFPSGHSSASFFAATYLYRYKKYLGVPAIILAGLIAFSRLYFYVHFPSDVLVGSLEGILVGIVASFVLQLFIKRPIKTKINAKKKARAEKKAAKARAKEEE
ncbi:MAG: phosphatase PAP2 family protein [Lachnospiraceae bacterium]|nr:phosphatase PAP2 family protein [Lachnospiraceae bacterium]